MGEMGPRSRAWNEQKASQDSLWGRRTSGAQGSRGVVLVSRDYGRAISTRGVRMGHRKSYMLVRLCTKRYGNVRSRSPALSTAFHKYGSAFLRMLTGQPRPLGRALSLVGQASCLSHQSPECGRALWSIG